MAIIGLKELMFVSDGKIFLLRIMLEGKTPFFIITWSKMLSMLHMQLIYITLYRSCG